MRFFFMHIRHVILALGLVCLCVCGYADLSMAEAQPAAAPVKASDEKNQYLISASQIQNDDPGGIVTANGAVEIHNDGKILQADEVQVQQKQNIMSASGNVAMLTQDKNVLFAKKVTMSNDFANGSGEHVGMLMVDNSRLAATDARRIDNRYMQFGLGMFSPCNLCVSNPRKAPLWQVKAVKITHDAVEKNLIYRDARIEMWGIPVFYTPYMSSPDPTVKRRQGFLTTHYVNSPTLGTAFVVPYYFDIAPDVDYTFKPNFNGKDIMRWSGTLRKRYVQGEVFVDHSLAFTDRTDDDGVTKYEQFRGHLSGFAHFDIDNIFRTGADFAVLTDKNYLARYGETKEDILTNRLYLEAFKGRGFGALEAVYLQDNRPGVRPNQPFVLPRLRVSQIGEPNMTLGGRWSFDGELTALTRLEGQNVKKLGTDFGWQRRDVLPLGFLSTLKASVREDAFIVNNAPSPDSPGVTYNRDATNRIFPQGQLTLSYPLAAYGETFAHTVEPIFALSASPTRKLDPRIPNEDSLDVDFDTSNLFELNRYPGTDRLEQGIRASYGFKTGFYTNSGSKTELTLGQSYRLSDDPLFPKGTGFDVPLSDYVGQLKFDPGSWLTMDYNFRFDKDLKVSRRHEISTSFGIPEFRPNFIYTYSDPAIFISGLSNRVEELKMGLNSNFVEFWSFSFGRTYDLRDPVDGLRTTSAALAYADECFTTSLSFSRDETIRTDIKSGDTYHFRVLFKNLGGFDG